jgi:hypothetical protein
MSYIFYFESSANYLSIPHGPPEAAQQFSIEPIFDAAFDCIDSGPIIVIGAKGQFPWEISPRVDLTPTVLDWLFYSSGVDVRIDCSDWRR